MGISDARDDEHAAIRGRAGMPPAGSLAAGAAGPCRNTDYETTVWSTILI